MGVHKIFGFVCPLFNVLRRMSTKKTVKIVGKRKGPDEEEKKTRGRSRSEKPLPKTQPLPTAPGVLTRRASVAAPSRPATPPVPRSLSRSSVSSSSSSASPAARSASVAPAPRSTSRPPFQELVNQARKYRNHADESLLAAKQFAQKAKDDPSRAETAKRLYRREMADVKHSSDKEVEVLSRMTSGERATYVKTLGEPHSVDVEQSFTEAFGEPYEVSAPAESSGPSAFDALTGPWEFHALPLPPGKDARDATWSDYTATPAATTTATPATFAVPDVPLTSTASPARAAASPVRPVASPVRPAASPVRPVASPVRPVASPAHVSPAVSPARAAASPVRPVASPAHVSPAVSPVRPVASPVRPVASPVRPVASPGASANAPRPPKDMRAIMNERQRRKEAWEAERKTPRTPMPFDPKNMVSDDDLLAKTRRRVNKNITLAEVAAKEAGDAYGAALAAHYEDGKSDELREQVEAAEARSKAADAEHRKAVEFQDTWTHDADFLAKRRAKMQRKREAKLPKDYAKAHNRLDELHGMREILDSNLADASLNEERRLYLTKRRDDQDREIDAMYDFIAAMDATLSLEWRERALGLRPPAATSAATARPPAVTGDAMMTSTRDEGLRSYDYSDRLAGLGVARIAAGLPYGGIRDGGIAPIHHEEKKGDQKQPNEPSGPANDASSHDDRVVRGYRGGGFIQNRDLPNSSITGRPTKEAGDVVAQAKASYASTTDSLRPQFPIAPAGSLIPDERTQLETQVLHDTFGEVLPGSGLGVTNKLFVMNQLREKNIHFMEPMDLPRRDDGPSCLVVPAPLSLQNVITKDDRSRMQQSLVARDLLAVMTEERAGSGSLNILGNDYGQLSSLSAKTLKRNAESPLEPIHRLPESMTNIRTPTGYTLSFRKSRRLFDALRYPERFDAQCAQSGGATMSVPNSLAMYPFPVGI